MAELFRVLFKDEYGDQLFEDRAGNELCTLEELQINVEIPDGTKRFDVVGFRRCDKNRFKAFVGEDKDGLYFEVPAVMGCNGILKNITFPEYTAGSDFAASNGFIDTLLKNLKKKVGDVIYLQIEY